MPSANPNTHQSHGLVKDLLTLSAAAKRQLRHFVNFELTIDIIYVVPQRWTIPQLWTIRSFFMVTLMPL